MQLSDGFRIYMGLKPVSPARVPYPRGLVNRARGLPVCKLSRKADALDALRKSWDVEGSTGWANLA